MTEPGYNQAKDSQDEINKIEHSKTGGFVLSNSFSFEKGQLSLVELIPYLRESVQLIPRNTVGRETQMQAEADINLERLGINIGSANYERSLRMVRAYCDQNRARMLEGGTILTFQDLARNYVESCLDSKNLAQISGWRFLLLGIPAVNAPTDQFYEFLMSQKNLIYILDGTGRFFNRRLIDSKTNMSLDIVIKDVSDEGLKKLVAYEEFQKITDHGYDGILEDLKEFWKRLSQIQKGAIQFTKFLRIEGGSDWGKVSNIKALYEQAGVSEELQEQVHSQLGDIKYNVILREFANEVKNSVMEIG